MKKCPFCAEEIQDEAIVCRYCGRDVAPSVPVPPPSPPAPVVAPLPSPSVAPSAPAVKQPSLIKNALLASAIVNGFLLVYWLFTTSGDELTGHLMVGLPGSLVFYAVAAFIAGLILQRFTHKVPGLLLLFLAMWPVYFVFLIGLSIVIDVIPSLLK